MEITPTQLEAIMPSCPYPEAYASAMNVTARRFNINNELRWACWLAIMAVETGELTEWREIEGENMWYAPYYGRGPVQLTTQGMYRAAGEYFGWDLVSFPDLVASQTQLGFDVAGWVFAVAPGFDMFEAYADIGDLWDIYLKVAGADNGTYLHRRAYYERALKVFGSAPAPNDGGSMPTGNDIIASARKLLGAPYRIWTPGMSIPTWLDDNRGDPPTINHIMTMGVECADLVCFAMEDNGLWAHYGTEAFQDVLVDQVPFDPSVPGEPGAVAYKPYSGPALGDQGHIAIFAEDGETLIQAIVNPGVTQAYDQQTVYSWGGDTEFTIYGKLPGVDYGSGATPAPSPPDEEIWKRYGWYTYESANSWNLKFYPPS